MFESKKIFGLAFAPEQRGAVLDLESHGASSSAVTRPMTERVEQRNRMLQLQRRAATLMQPPKKIAASPTTWHSICTIPRESWLNVLLICIPISWALHFALPEQDTLIFVFSFLAIIPLAQLLAFATEELSIRVSQTLASIIDATLGNAIELILSIIALTKCELDVVQSTLVGSILSNLLLVLGICFFAGGLRFSEQGFGILMAQMKSTLLTTSVVAVLIPSAIVFAAQKISSSKPNFDATLSILHMSHGVSIILLFTYMCYLFFQLYSHKALYEDGNVDVLESKRYEKPLELKMFRRGKQPSNIMDGPLVSSPQLSAVSLPQLNPDAESTTAAPPSLEEEDEEPKMNMVATLGLLVAVTVLVVITAEFLVESIDGLTRTKRISKVFVGVILFPMVGNVAQHITEHVTAVKQSVKDKLSLSLAVAIGASIQIALFVIPLIVTLGWILEKPLTLLFDPLQSIALFLSVVTVNYAVQDGKSTWLEGIVLMGLYLILCITFWYYPGASETTCS